MRFSTVPSGNSWRPAMDSDTTDRSYWLNWRFFFCAVLVLFVMAISSILIWKYEGEEEEEAWRPSLRTVHPSWLLVFRVTAFVILVALTVFILLVNGASILYFYTMWTFLLVTLYFGLGLLLSAYGCHQFVKVTGDKINPTPSDAEGGSVIAPTDVETLDGPLTMKNSRFRKHLNIQKIVELGNSLFQIIYQANAGALLFTDFVFWFIIFPFLAIKDYDLSFQQVGMHSINVIFFICDTALNRLRFRWFRIAYFMLWTSIYVIFQWVIHARIPIWWPYTFLELSSATSPIWYLAAAILHVPCYGVFHLIIKLKHTLSLRWFHRSYYLNN